jgi:hypothetical protein
MGTLKSRIRASGVGLWALGVWRWASWAAVQQRGLASSLIFPSRSNLVEQHTYRASPRGSHGCRISIIFRCFRLETPRSKTYSAARRCLNLPDPERSRSCIVTSVALDLSAFAGPEQSSSRRRASSPVCPIVLQARAKGLTSQAWSATGQYVSRYVQRCSQCYAC